MSIAYEPVDRDDGADYAAFLLSEPWPFHAAGAVDPVAIAERVAAGEYTTADVETFWIVADGARAGIVKVFDLVDDTPLFDLRIASAYRGRGIGKETVRWLVRHVFTTRPEARRVEGTTRADNAAMRAVFRATGFAKEAHYRDGWPGVDGALHDSIGYAILRRDWLSGTVTPVNWDDEAVRGGPSRRSSR